LAGYDLSPAQLHPGETAEITLYWQPLAPLGADYTTFVHLVNAAGVVIGASDHRPGSVVYPTSLWRSGDILRDTHTFTLTADLGQPPYTIETGLYTVVPNAGEPALQHLGRPERLEVPAGQPAGQPAGNRPPVPSLVSTPQQRLRPLQRESQSVQEEVFLV
jgi:hypothetical protein